MLQAVHEVGGKEFSLLAEKLRGKRVLVPFHYPA